MEQDQNPVRGRLDINLAGINPLGNGQTDGARGCSQGPPWKRRGGRPRRPWPDNALPQRRSEPTASLEAAATASTEAAPAPAPAPETAEVPTPDAVVVAAAPDVTTKTAEARL